MRPAHALVRPTHALKMKDLERATGVGRETIRFYIREGLLPEPQRPGRNVAWYDASFVERVGLIKELQQKRFLPLHAIKAILGAGDGAAPPSRTEAQTLLELDGKLFAPVAGVPALPPERVATLAARTALPVAEIERIAEAGAVPIVRRDGERWIEGDAIRIVELWGRMRQAGYSEALGFEPAQIALYVEFVQALAREELRLFTKGITGRVTTEGARRMAEDGIVLLNLLIGLLRKQTLLRYIAEGNVPPARAKAPRRPRRRRTR
jgi:DNA-binding transcriptional MerR regulator